MVLEITTSILPLYQEMIKQKFTDFMQGTNFVRVCNRIGISKEYTFASNKAVEAAKNSAFGVFFPGMESYENLLANFLNLIFVSNEAEFADIVCTLVIADLESATRFVNISEILKDLDSLGLSKHKKLELISAYRKYDSNDALKVKILATNLREHATDGRADQEHYDSLRANLISRKNLKEKLPHFLTEYANLQDFRKFAQTLGGYADRRAYIHRNFAPLIELVSKVSNNHIAEAIIIDNAYINQTWQKAMTRMNEDPEGAITIARTLIETVCKHILDESKSFYEDGAELSVIYKSVCGLLNLSPDQHTQPIFKQILSGCFSVVNGLGSIRNKISDAHGISETRIRPSSRHAGLAVNLSGAVCQFLLESFMEKKK